MVYVLSALIFLLFFVLAGVGVIFKGRAIRGSCGGIAVMGADGEPLTCSSCPNRKKGAVTYAKSCSSDKVESD